MLSAVFIGQPSTRAIFFGTDSPTVVFCGQPSTRAIFGNGGAQGPAGPTGPQGPSGGALVTTGVSVDTTMAANAAYYPDSTSLIIFQFPVSPTDGDVCKIFGYGSGGWQLDLRSGETVNLIGSTNTTSGPLGTIYSTHTNDSATFIYIGGAWLCDALEVGFS